MISIRIMLRHTFSYAFVIILFIAPALADEWSCRNNDVEIGCDSKACQITLPDGFTPTELTVNTNGKVSFCAYTGCWEGQAAKTLRAGKYFTAVGLNLPWSTSDTGSKGNFAATIDTEAHVAIVVSDTFTHPMTCGTR